jgi:hypothetical protein
MSGSSDSSLMLIMAEETSFELFYLTGIKGSKGVSSFFYLYKEGTSVLDFYLLNGLFLK